MAPSSRGVVTGTAPDRDAEAPGAVRSQPGRFPVPGLRLWCVMRPGDDGVRIAELVGTLSYAADLGLGQPMDHCLRQTVIALRLAELVGAGDRDRATTFYLGLLRTPTLSELERPALIRLPHRCGPGRPWQTAGCVLAGPGC
jgi:hypothetical protein